ncbi:hypothetical protein ABH920_005210, partial [Catenulispora sp. EB89]
GHFTKTAPATYTTAKHKTTLTEPYKP